MRGMMRGMREFPTRRRGLAAAAILGGVLAGPHPAAAQDAVLQASSGNRASSGLELTECPVPGAEKPGLCGTLRVFEDRELRQGRTIDLAILVLPATGPDPAPDPIFLLAGGPGQAATVLGPAIDQIIPPAVRRSRDVVLVDQRGTGRSNGLQCPIVDLDEILEALAFEFSPESLRACRKAFDADLTMYTTPLAMDDLDDVREELGYSKINLWGGSYGTRAALVYMRRHPQRVRAAVLRGVAPTNATLPLHFARDAQRALLLLTEACAAADACERSFPNTPGDLESLLARLSAKPANVEAIHPLTQEPTDARITAEAFAGGLRLLQYGTYFSRHIPRIVEAGLRGDFEPFLSLTMPFAGQLIQQIYIGMFLSVVCAEDVPYLNLEKAEAEAEGTYLSSSASRYMTLACEGWPRGDLPDGYREPVRANQPVLVVSGDEDPVTPPSWGEEVARYLPNAYQLVLPRTGHFPTAPGCSAELIAGFLDRGSAEGMDPACLEEIPRPPFVVSESPPD